MTALSTSWISQQVNRGEDLVAALQAFDISGVELEYRIRRPVQAQLKKLLRQANLKVVSVHNYFPVPVDDPKVCGSGDLFLLSHPDRNQRRQAISATIRTIEHANDFEAQAVVLHCGYVDMAHEKKVLSGYFEAGLIESEAAQDFIQKKTALRDQLKAKHMDSLLFSLDQLIRQADKENILLGLENRHYYHELPGTDDFSRLFHEFEGAPLGYWHDTGHADAHERLTLIPPHSLLKRYADRLIGIHLHDAKGLSDHLPPGSGEIDFNRIKPCLKADTIKVLELKPKTADTEVIKGLCFLHSLGIH
jgi:sugar phosphate isomerase/epimerase